MWGGSSDWNWQRYINIRFIMLCSMCAHSCPTLCGPMDCSPLDSSAHAVFQSRTMEWGCHFLLQGIFLTQGSNPCLLRLLHWQADSLQLVPPGKSMCAIWGLKNFFLPCKIHRKIEHLDDRLLTWSGCPSHPQGRYHRCHPFRAPHL